MLSRRRHAQARAAMPGLAAECVRAGLQVHRVTRRFGGRGQLVTRTLMESNIQEPQPYLFGTLLSVETLILAKTVPSRYGIAMKIWERLLEVAGTQRGFLTPADAEALDINPVELRKMARRGRLEHVAHGVYRFTAFPRAPHDEMLEAVLWCGGRGVVSHESALDLLDLCDVNPTRVHITVPPAYRPRRRDGQMYRVHREALDENQVDVVAGIPVVTAAKAIEQAAAAGVDPRLVEQAVHTARRRDLISRAEEERLFNRQLATLPQATPALAPAP